MIYGIWEGVFLFIILLSAFMGRWKGGLRTLTFFSGHLLPSVFSLVFTPTLATLFTAKTEIALPSLFPVFLLLYAVPMILFTQLLRVMYIKTKVYDLSKKSFKWRLGGWFMGMLTGVYFSFLLTWFLMLQPWISQDSVFSSGGTIFSHTAALLQYFMRFYV
ncbi:MAG: hypothetical protein PQJ59_09155 [Spirochaetales bacterium]|nr:hypothetical protein [Spirochaetales bacterium]